MLGSILCKKICIEKVPFYRGENRFVVGGFSFEIHGAKLCCCSQLIFFCITFFAFLLHVFYHSGEYFNRIKTALKDKWEA
jgi:hypothetical protein